MRSAARPRPVSLPAGRSKLKPPPRKTIRSVVVAPELTRRTPIKKASRIAERTVVALICLAVLALTLQRLKGVTHYLSADAGHYLADADAVFGDGIREARHLPLYPAILGVLRLVAGDFDAVLLGMGVVVLVLGFGFYSFVRKRTGSPVAEYVGTAVFLLSPLWAEAIGWYGAAMLLGIGLSLFAMRLIDNALSQPSAGRAAMAGSAAGSVGLTHPLPFALLAEISVMVVVILALSGVRRAVERPREASKEVVRRLSAIFVIAAVAVLMVVSQISFYTNLQSPVTISFDPSRLALITDWVFREDPQFWSLLLILGVLLIPAARMLNGAEGARLGIWATVAGVVAVANVVAASGDPSYVTRHMYLLPVLVASTVAVIVALGARRATSSRSRRVITAVLVVVLLGGLVRAGFSYVTRLDVSLQFYNTVTPEELRAIQWLQRREGTVAVSSKAGDKNAGTLYAWLIEGLAHTRALGPGEPSLYLIEKVHQDSVDMERILSGSTVVETGAVRLSADEAKPGRVELAGLVEEDWFSFLGISVSSGGGAEGGDPTSELRTYRTARGSTLEAKHNGTKLDVSVEAGQLQPEVLLDIVPPAEAEYLTVSFDHPPFGARALVKRLPRGGSITVDGGDQKVTATIEVLGATEVSSFVETDARSGLASLRVHSAGAGPLRLRLRPTGLDKREFDAVSYRDVDLMRKHDVRHVYAWRDSAALLSPRRCFRARAGNSEVVVFDVVPPCNPSRPRIDEAR